MAVEEHATNEGTEKTREKEEPETEDSRCDCFGFLEQLFSVGKCTAQPRDILVSGDPANQATFVAVDDPMSGWLAPLPLLLIWSLARHNGVSNILKERVGVFWISNRIIEFLELAGSAGGNYPAGSHTFVLLGEFLRERLG